MDLKKLRQIIIIRAMSEGKERARREKSPPAAREGGDGKKVFVRTFGCQMNDYDSRRAMDVLREAGMREADSPAAADVVLYNSCSVRERAQEKVVQELHFARRRKRDNPDLIIGVGGCVASQEGEALFARAPWVDVVFGPQTIHRLPDLIARRRQTGKPQADVSFPAIEKFDSLPPPRADGPRAFVSAMEGCSKYCTFCVVPYTRGEEVSRPLSGILEEVASLALDGVREITLLGQNVNAWRERAANGARADFAHLLECVALTPGIERVRFTTSHPVEFSERLIGAFARIRELACGVHLPAQSGSDAVLARMKRGYTALEYKSIIRKLRAARPSVCVSSDFIVGFPGESADDFERTIALANSAGFDFSYSFLYSPRPGTPAARFADDTPLAEKKSRLLRLQSLLEEGGRKISDAMVGTRQRILLEGKSKRDPRELCGRAANGRMVNLSAPADWIGKFAEVEITRAASHSLRGRAIGAPQ
jgi:tRNA-2-methylthio-N6-dimethylallyladenosine synthase